MSFNDHNCDALIYILDCGIDESKKQKIEKLCSGRNAVFFIDAKKTLDGLDYDLNIDRGSIAAYARLFIGSMIPNGIDKVIYLDSDTLVRGSLLDLYNYELDSFTIGGVRDSFSVLNKKVFGVKRGELFVNSGVLLVDLSKWREEEIEKKIYQILTEKQEVFQGDQGIINIVFHGKVKELPLVYDVMSYLYDFTYEEMRAYRKPDNYFDKQTVIKASDNPIIVHFSSSFRSYRPWEKESNHPFGKEWDMYYKMLEGEYMGAKKNKRKYIVFPIWLIGIVHAYIRPALFLFKEVRNEN